MKCPYCKNRAQKVNGDKVYPNRPDLHKNKFFFCGPCKAFVGCHANGEPMGSMADHYLRSLRQSVHVLLDPLHEFDPKRRTLIYKWLAREMKMNPADCHVGMFREEQCHQAIKILKGNKA